MCYKKMSVNVLAIIAVFLMSSCLEVKNIAYFQKISDKNESSKQQKNSKVLFDAHIKPKDMLSISVVTSDPDASRNYNLFVPQMSIESANQNSLFSQPALQNYLVESDGYIDFPVLGKIYVSGLTRTQLEMLLFDQFPRLTLK